MLKVRRTALILVGVLMGMILAPTLPVYAQPFSAQILRALRSIPSTLLFSSDSTFDIGTAGTGRPAFVYAGTAVDVGGARYNGTTFKLVATAFASLGTPLDGNVAYCNDCTIANPCAGSGTGALAKRLNGTWVCN